MRLVHHSFLIVMVVVGCCFIASCATMGLNNRGIFERNGYRMELEVLPDEGFVPLDAFVHVVLEVPEKDYHHYRGCFQLRVRYGPDDETMVQQKCEAYDPDARGNEEGRIPIEYELEHEFYYADLYQIVVEVRPAKADDNRVLVAGSVSLAVKQRKRYVSP